MAKKKRARGDFNMAAEVRELLKQNPAMTGKEVYEALSKKFPRRSINENSCGVAFSTARKTLGITKGRKRRRRKAGKKKVAVRKKRPAATAASIDVGTLQAAAKFLSEVGNPDKALAAVRQVQSLQIK